MFVLKGKGCRFALAKGIMVLIWEFIGSVGYYRKRIRQNKFRKILLNSKKGFTFAPALRGK